MNSNGLETRIELWEIVNYERKKKKKKNNEISTQKNIGQFHFVLPIIPLFPNKHLIISMTKNRRRGRRRNLEEN